MPRLLLWLYGKKSRLYQPSEFSLPICEFPFAICGRVKKTGQKSTVFCSIFASFFAKTHYILWSSSYFSFKPQFCICIITSVCVEVVKKIPKRRSLALAEPTNLFKQLSNMRYQLHPSNFLNIVTFKDSYKCSFNRFNHF